MQLSVKAMYMFSLIFSKQRIMIDNLRHFTRDTEDKFCSRHTVAFSTWKLSIIDTFSPKRQQSAWYA